MRRWANHNKFPKVVWEEVRVAALSHTYAIRRKVPISYNGAPQIRLPQKIPLPVDRSPNLPHPWTSPTYDAKRIRSAVFPQCTGQTDRQTERPTDRSTDRSRETLTTRPLRDTA